MRLLIAFIAVPLIEIGIFIQVGDTIGLWPTLFILLPALQPLYLVPNFKSCPVKTTCTCAALLFVAKK